MRSATRIESDAVSTRVHELAALEQLAERVPDVIYRYRLRPTRGFDFISAAVADVSGYTPEEYYADPDLAVEVVHPDDRHVVDALFRRSRVEERFVLRWVRKDGATAWTEQRSAPVYDEAGELVAVDGIAREIEDPTRSPGETIRLLGGVRLDLAQQRLFVDGRLVHLTPAEFRLLACLTACPGEVVSRVDLVRHLWRSEHAGNEHSCETHISTLRRKIERDPRSPQRILTVRGRGYRYASR